MNIETTIVKCNACIHPCTLKLGRNMTASIPAGCPYGFHRQVNWERVEEVEQSTEGDSMSHVPVIHKAKIVLEPKKIWEYSMVNDEGCLRIKAVDSETGQHVCGLFSICGTGKVIFVSGVRESLFRQGYSRQGLQFKSVSGEVAQS